MKRNYHLFHCLLMVLSAVMILPTMVFSSNYASAKQSILTPQGEALGVLYKGAKINVSSKKTSLSGWVMDGNEYVIFYAHNARIKLAKIDEVYIKDLIVKKTIKDEFDVIWKKVELSFTLKNNKHISSTRDSLWEEEEELYQRCGSCHNNIPAHDHTPNQWPPAIKSMKQNAGLSNKEVKMLSTYLQYQSLKEEK